MEEGRWRGWEDGVGDVRDKRRDCEKVSSHNVWHWAKQGGDRHEAEDGGLEVERHGSVLNVSQAPRDFTRRRDLGGFWVGKPVALMV